MGLEQKGALKIICIIICVHMIVTYQPRLCYICKQTFLTVSTQNGIHNVLITQSRVVDIATETAGYGFIEGDSVFKLVQTIMWD